MEMLIVVAMMAVVAGMVLMQQSDSRDYALQQVVRIEMEELRKATVKYLQDQNRMVDMQGTGLQNSPADISFLLAPLFDPNDSDGDGDTEEYINPATADNIWNPDYRSGWRGPYIKGGDASYQTPYVTIGDNLLFDGSGNPESTTLEDGDPVFISSLARPDPFSRPSTTAGYYVWTPDNAEISDTNPELERLGRPYLFFDLDSYQTTESKARIISMGLNGTYDGRSDCDLTQTDSTQAGYCTREMLCLAEDSVDTGNDDLVLCL